MNQIAIFLTVPLYFFALVGVISAGYVIVHLRTRLAWALGGTLLLLAEIVICYALEIALPTYEEKLLLRRLQTIGYAFLPVFWLTFVLRYTGNARWATWTSIGIQSVLPLVVGVLALFDATYPWVVRVGRLVNAPSGPMLETQLAPLGFFYSLYVVVILVGGFFFLFRTTLQSRRLYMKQGIGLIAAPVAGVVAIYTMTPGANVFVPYTLAPYILALDVAVFAWLIFRLQLGDVLPVVHEQIFDEMPDAVVIVDRRQRIADLNRAAANLFKVDENEVLGRSLANTLPELANQIDLAPVQRGRVQTVEFFRGNLHYFDARLSFITDAEGRPTNCQIWMRDISPLKRGEEILRRKLFESVTLRQAGMALAVELDMDQVLERVLEYLRKAVSYDRAMILLEENEIVRVGAEAGEILSGSENLQRSLKNYLLIQQMHHLPETICVGTAHPEHPQYALVPPEAKSFMAIPLMLNQKFSGCLVLQSQQPGQYGYDEQALAETFAVQFAIAIQNAYLFQQVREQTLTDPLTGVYNRRYFFDMANREIEQARLLQRELTVLMFDLDHFKQVNDVYGHLAGDQVLARIAQVARQQARGTDVICRYGGEEFAVLLPETDLQTGVQVAERLRQDIAQVRLTTRKGEVTVTISIGAATLTEQTATIEDLIHQADNALYVAKQSGRNCVRF
jgi:diguanylate cyclase (GGDEF)-like protein/PAS domain S-box-containing protein